MGSGCVLISYSVLSLIIAWLSDDYSSETETTDTETVLHIVQNRPIGCNDNVITGNFCDGPSTAEIEIVEYYVNKCQDKSSLHVQVLWCKYLIVVC